MAPEYRAAVRQARAKPIFDQLEEWLHAQLPRLSGKSPLAQAIRYALGRMPKARPYLSNGHLDLDNNAAERAVKPVAIGRKNWMFSGSARGGKTMAIAFTLIETAKLNNVDPQAWLHLGAGPNCRSQDHSAGRVAPLALRCPSSVTGHAGRAPERRHRTVTAYKTFPKEHWPRIHSTNPLERLNKEIKAANQCRGIFLNEAAITRLVGALMLEQNDEWR